MTRRPRIDYDLSRWVSHSPHTDAVGHEHVWREVERYKIWDGAALGAHPPDGLPWTVVEECRLCPARRTRTELEEDT